MYLPTGGGGPGRGRQSRGQYIPAEVITYRRVVGDPVEGRGGKDEGTGDWGLGVYGGILTKRGGYICWKTNQRMTCKTSVSTWPMREGSWR